MRVDQIKIGDKILPPARELRLWMRRWAQEHNIPEAEIYMTVLTIEEASPTKKGRWLKITGKMSNTWDEGKNPHPFKFLAQPHTSWPLANPLPF